MTILGKCGCPLQQLHSPQLAPVERVWKLARRMATHNRFFATLGDVLASVPSVPTAGENLTQYCGDYAA
jgi:hypothetical protein